MKTIDNIIKNSGDSIIQMYSYSDGILTIGLDLAELDKKYKIKIITENLSFSHFYLENEASIYRTCRIEINELSNILSLQNGIYIPSNDFGKLMKEIRLNYNLVYGKKALKTKYLFSLVGYDRILSCDLSDMNCITIEEISSFG